MGYPSKAKNLPGWVEEITSTSILPNHLMISMRKKERNSNQRLALAGKAMLLAFT